MSKTSLIRITIFSVLCWGSFAFAWPPTFGDELNFTSDAIEKAWEKQENKNWVNNPENEAARDRFAKIVRESCGDCTVRARKDKYGNRIWKVSYPDGWFFNIAVDPSVVEIQVAATTVAHMKAIKDRIDRDIFKASVQAGLRKDASGDHMHVGRDSALGNDLMLFRNALVDEVNHPSAAGVFFSNDIYNAPVVGVLTLAQKAAFEKVIADVDAGRVRSIDELAERIRVEVYYRTTLPSWTPADKYQSINLNRIGNPHFKEAEQTYEKRGMPSFNSADDMVLHAELEENRLENLRGTNEPIPLKIVDPRKMTEREMFDNFSDYLQRSRMKLDSFRKYLSGSMRMMKPKVATGAGGAGAPICKDVYAPTFRVLPR